MRHLPRAAAVAGVLAIAATMLLGPVGVSDRPPAAERPPEGASAPLLLGRPHPIAVNCRPATRQFVGVGAIRRLRVENGARAACGDGPALTTVTPDGDGVADAAILRLNLRRPASVVVAACADRLGGLAPIWVARRRLGRGTQRIVWHVDPATPPRSYMLAVDVRSAHGEVVAGACFDRPADMPAPIVRVAGIAAAFRRRSYRPGERAVLSVTTAAPMLRVRAYRIDGTGLGGRPPGVRAMLGSPVSAPASIRWSAVDQRPADVAMRIPASWRSGLYVVRLAARGHVGYAPVIVRPRRLGTAPVAVVLPTNTWAAYNFADVDEDGWGDTWYAFHGERSVRLGVPFVDGGAPPAWRNRGFLSWLGRSGHRADMLSDDDLDAIRSVGQLARAYRAIVFAGHEEYVTTHVYDLIRGYRDLGGRLAFLSADNLFWRVVRRGDRLVRAGQWRDLGRPEAAVVGVQYRANDGGARRGPYRVLDTLAAPWLFRGTTLRAGSSFGAFGVEFDMRTSDSPPATHLLASVDPHFPDPTVRGEMTFYRLHGAEVFAAGTLSFTDAAQSPAVAPLLRNLWRHLARPGP